MAVFCVVYLSFQATCVYFILCEFSEGLGIGRVRCHFGLKTEFANPRPGFFDKVDNKLDDFPRPMPPKHFFSLYCRKTAKKRILKTVQKVRGKGMTRGT